MKQILILAMLITMGFGLSAKDTQVTLKSNITCGNCVTAIKKAVSGLASVDLKSADIEAKTITLAYDDEKVSKDKIISTIKDAGFRADPNSYSTSKLKDNASKDHKSCSTEEVKKKCGSAKSCCLDKAKVSEPQNK